MANFPAISSTGRKEVKISGVSQPPILFEEFRISTLNLHWLHTERKNYS